MKKGAQTTVQTFGTSLIVTPGRVSGFRQNWQRGAYFRVNAVGLYPADRLSERAPIGTGPDPRCDLTATRNPAPTLYFFAAFVNTRMQRPVSMQDFKRPTF